MFSILLVVPTLNSYHLLPRLVKSLEDQSFNQWRVIFIDGKSSLIHKAWLREQCHKDSRFSWEEEIHRGGIFAAMNQGFKHASATDWVLFWGSDDLAADSEVFNRVQKRIESMINKPDLYICSARYYSNDYSDRSGTNLRLQRLSKFSLRKSFRNSLFLGSTPPHQATFFGPGSRKILDTYDESFKLAGDLDYFLRLSQLDNLSVVVDKSVVVLMGSSGVSAKENKIRFNEVILSYRRAFGSFWILAFLSRYLQRAWSALRK